MEGKLFYTREPKLWWKSEKNNSDNVMVSLKIVQLPTLSKEGNNQTVERALQSCSTTLVVVVCL